MNTKTVFEYLEMGWPVFPCGQDKRPLTARGLHGASRVKLAVERWQWLFHDCLWGMPTGNACRMAVLDIDIKGDVNGVETLGGLGFWEAPSTPTVHTRSGGMHLYFRMPQTELRNTAGSRGRGIGPGLDWRGEGGYVILPTPGSGYRWDFSRNLETRKPLPIPPGLLPREPERVARGAPVEPCVGLSPYAERAIDSACEKIRSAPAGEQEATLNAEAYSIGTLVGAGAAPRDYALAMLTSAATHMPSYDARRPWHGAELASKVARAFGDGMRNPRASASPSGSTK